MLKSWQVLHEMPQKRQRVVKKFLDETTLNHRIEDPFKNFGIKVFNATLDIVVNELEIIFEGLPY